MSKQFQLLHKAQAQLSIWDEVLSRTQTQLSSLSNLVEQLETVQRCTSSKKLGVISQDTTVAHLLQGKIVKKMERALEEMNKERSVLREVVQKLKRFANEGQTVLEETAKQKGLDASCFRTAETFSLADHVSWLRQLHCAYRSDFDEKMQVLQSLQYTSESMSHVCGVWEKRPPGIDECLSYLVYTVNYCQSH